MSSPVRTKSRFCSPIAPCFDIVTAGTYSYWCVRLLVLIAVAMLTVACRATPFFRTKTK